MKIYRATIDTYEQYEGMGNPAYVEYGTDRKVLWDRWQAAGLKIAPDSAWTAHADGMSCEAVVDGIEYEARFDIVELVC